MRGFILAVPIMLLAACNGGLPEVSGTGEPVTRPIIVSRLSGITVEGSMDVRVMRGDTQRVEITGQPELIDLVKTKVDNGMWHISTTKSYTTDKHFVVHLTVPMLNSVVIKGSGDVVSEGVYNTGKTYLAVLGSGSIAIDTLNEGLLEMLIEGSGSIGVNGTCRELELTSNGSGSLNALGLVANEAEISLEGSGSAEVTVISSLEARLTSSGSLRYRGKPEMDTKVEGSGSVTALP
jgi:Putative auto-transporter adhesin, head GIN domain